MPNAEVQPTIQDVLTAINGFSNTVEERFSTIERNMVTKNELNHTLAAMETRLVTKDYLDEKLFDLRGDQK